MKVINLSQVVKIEIFDFKPIAFLKFFKAGIREEYYKFGIFRKFDSNLHCFLHETTKIVKINEKNNIDLNNIVKFEYLDQNGIYNVKYNTNIETPFIKEPIFNLSKEYADVDKLGTICNERNIEADFNLITNLANFIQKSNLLSDQFRDNLLFIYKPTTLYEFEVQLKPHIKYTLVNGEEIFDFSETLTDINDKLEELIKDNPYLKKVL